MFPNALTSRRALVRAERQESSVFSLWTTRETAEHAERAHAHPVAPISISSRFHFDTVVSYSRLGAENGAVTRRLASKERRIVS